MVRDRDNPVKFHRTPADRADMDATVSIPGNLFGSGTAGQRVLVVDDEELLRTIVRERLERAGYHVEEAASGEEALGKLGNGRYSVLLTDLRMPGMDGIALLGEWSRRSPETAGIVMSANAELGNAVNALKMGACDYITKPFNFDVLLVTIQNAIRKKDVERMLLDYRVNLEKKVKEQTDVINSMYLGSIHAFITALEARDKYTRGHSDRVTELAKGIAREMRLSGEEIEKLHQASVLHDLGKIGVKEEILNKPGCLTKEEYDEIKKHPEEAKKILTHVKDFHPLLPAILHHHERYDGGGYPGGLSGDRIPLLSRIMAVADTYDSMTSTRAYRNALPVSRAIAEIRRCAGAQFDPEIVPHFLAYQSRILVPGDV